MKLPLFPETACLRPEHELCSRKRLYPAKKCPYQNPVRFRPEIERCAHRKQALSAKACSDGILQRAVERQRCEPLVGLLEQEALRKPAQLFLRRAAELKRKNPSSGA